MTTLRYIEDSLDDIKRIITCYFDTIDYSGYIQDLNNILNVLESKKINNRNEKELAWISDLEKRAHHYLNKAESLQVHYQNQEASEC